MIYFPVMLLASVAFTSCDNEEDDIFEASAAERLEQYKTQYSDMFTSKGGKWVMEYFANDWEQGYAMVLTFSGDGSVTVAGNNKWINGYKSETSLWRMISDNGPVLTFDSYNTVFHVFSTPENINGGPVNDRNEDIDETGEGHGGDYEFMVMGATDDSGNTVRLKGKKRGYTILMHRLDASTDDEAYLAEYAAAPAKMFHEKITPLYMVDETGERFVVTQKEGVFSFYPEAGDAVTQTVSYNALVKPDGIRFMNMIEIPRANGATYTVQSFKLGEKQELISTDGSSKATITAGPLSELFVKKSYEWAVSIDEADCGESMNVLIENLIAEIKKIPGKKRQTFQWMEIGFDENTEKYVLNIKTSAYLCPFYGEVTVINDNTVKFNFPSDEETISANTSLSAEAKNSLTNYKGAPSIKTLLETLNASTFTVEPASVLNPSVTKMVSTANAADFFTVKLK